MAIYGHIWTQFFIDARDGAAGGRVGGRASRASMKNSQEEHPVLFFSSMRATGRRAGGSGGRMSRASMKNYKRSVRSRCSTIFWPDLSKNAIFKTPLKRCASTRAFEPYQFPVIWRSWSKVMAKLLKSPHVIYPFLSYLNILDSPSPPIKIGILIGN